MACKFHFTCPRKANKARWRHLAPIERRRNGDAIDQGLVKKVVESFVSLESDLNKASLDNYKEHFEISLLSATEAYYNHESDLFVVENYVSDYLKKAEECLKASGNLSRWSLQC
jgi:cullin 1